MSPSLNMSLQRILQQGIDMVREHRSVIQPEWMSLVKTMKKRDSQLGNEMRLAMDFLSDYLFSEKEVNSEALLTQIHKDMRKFNTPIHPNHLIYVMTLLESASYKAIKICPSVSNNNYQAVQFLFTKISEQVLSFPFKENLDIDSFLNQLASSKQLPVEWIAKVENGDGTYTINKMYGVDQSMILQETISADSLFLLSESLLENVPRQSGKERKISPLPWEEEILLICTNGSPTAEILPFINFSLQVLASSKKTMLYSQRRQQWKDAVLLFNDWIIRSQSLNEAIENITFGFAHYLPFERCALFSYSHSKRSGFGLFGHHFNIQAIRRIHESITNMPFIEKKLAQLQTFNENQKHVQPIWIPDASKVFPMRYIRQFHLQSIVVAPIYVPSDGKLIGAAILDQGPDSHFRLSRELYIALMKFGQCAGQMLSKFGGEALEQTLQPLSLKLSPRELEVLELMAEGASTTEAAECLGLSEYTVRDYVSAIMQKMNAKNRTQAAVKAVRNGII
ncbi:MAG TPA: response regulator transcription factor [Bacillales bacterium]|nr:response regulator transcription factor [Bacillales bacterium]